MSITRSIKLLISTVFNFCIKNFYTKPLWIVRLIRNPAKYCRHQSYYPEKPTKKYIQVFWEQFCQIIIFGTPNEFYFSYGFDVKSKEEMDRYFHVVPFIQLRNKYNILGQHGSTAILRNKLYFEMFASYMGVNTPLNIGLLKKDSVFDITSKKHSSIIDFFKGKDGDYFVKLINGECGCGIFTLNVKDSIFHINKEEGNVQKISETVGNGTFLIQKVVVQHPEMARLHPESLNSIRLVTVKNIYSGKIEIMPSILRIGTGNSIVDNTSQGGVAVGIDTATGYLKSHGFLKPQFGGRVDIHPDSKIRFEEFRIPYWSDVIEQAKRLHAMLPDIHSIGWDIALDGNGPVFIEGNDNWEINGPQICHGGLKETYTRLLLADNNL